MNILRLDHLEFHVGDARLTAYYLCNAFGFRVYGQGGPQTGLKDQYSLLLGQGDIRLVVTSGLTPEHPATQYVNRHGDGVAIIAFEVDNVAEAYAEAVANGAVGLSAPTVFDHRGERLWQASVSGFSDVTHRLVERQEAAQTSSSPREGSATLALPREPAFLPGAFDPVPGDPLAAGEPGRLLKVIDHLAICVPAGNLPQTSRYYQEAFGFAEIFEEYIDVGGQGMNSKVVQSPSRAVTFTLIEPDVSRRPGQIDDFLQWHAGAGVQHVAFLTDDIVAAVRTFAGRGVGFLSTPGAYYDALTERLGSIDIPVDRLREIGVLVDTDHWGQMYQIFTQSLHVRRTLFLELIERHGALTFGSRNIKALYEAKERELAAPQV